MNAVNNEQEYLVQKIRTQYTEKQHTESGTRKKLCKKRTVRRHRPLCNLWLTASP